MKQTDFTDNGLTEEENLQLGKAEIDLKRAQEAYDAVAHLRQKKVAAFVRKFRANRAKPSVLELRIQHIQSERRQEEYSRIKERETQKRTFSNGYKRNDDGNRHPPERLAEIFRQTGKLDLFATQIGTTRRSAIRLLKSSAVDIIEEIALEWEAGTSLRSLSAKHGPLPQTISRWIKSTGRQIKPRNANQKYDQKLMEQLFTQKWSTNKIAIELKCSWATVQKVRDEYQKRNASINSPGSAI